MCDREHQGHTSSLYSASSNVNSLQQSCSSGSMCSPLDYSPQTRLLGTHSDYICKANNEMKKLLQSLTLLLGGTVWYEFGGRGKCVSFKDPRICCFQALRDI